MNKMIKTTVALVAAGVIGGVAVPTLTVSAAAYKGSVHTKGKLTVGFLKWNWLRL